MSKGKKRGPRERAPRIYYDHRGELHRKLTKEKRDRERSLFLDRSSFLASFTWFKQQSSEEPDA